MARPSRSPRRSRGSQQPAHTRHSATTTDQGVQRGGLSDGPRGHFRGVDFERVGVEQPAKFVDSHGWQYDVHVYLPRGHSKWGWPVAIYIHSLGYNSPLIESSRPTTFGIQTLMENFIVVSPIIGLKDPDAYFDNDRGTEAIAWVTELVRTLAGGFSEYRGAPRIDTERIAITGVSLGGGATYVLGASLHSLLSCVAPVAAYHAEKRREELAAGLAKLPVYCVHSTSHTEKTCPIEDEETLWERIRELGGCLHVEKVQCKHGKTFSHAYEHGDELWQWVLQQRRSCRLVAGSSKE